MVIPASCKLEGEYGETGVCAGVPAVIGTNGVEKIIELPLTDTEKEKFHLCCDHIRENIRIAAEIKE